MDASSHEHSNDLASAFSAYANARAKFLRELGCAQSCRDPLAEFSEKIVARLLGATIAESRIQKGHDLVCPNGHRVQVKYLANPDVGHWVNEHTIVFTESVEEYALVLFIALRLDYVLVFSQETLQRVCALLKKRHPMQDSTLQFTRRNLLSILEKKAEFEALGVRVYQPAVSKGEQMDTPSP